MSTLSIQSRNRNDPHQNSAFLSKFPELKLRHCIFPSKIGSFFAQIEVGSHRCHCFPTTGSPSQCRADISIVRKNTSAISFWSSASRPLLVNANKMFDNATVFLPKYDHLERYSIASSVPISRRPRRHSRCGRCSCIILLSPVFSSHWDFFPNSASRQSSLASSSSL